MRGFVIETFPNWAIWDLDFGYGCVQFLEFTTDERAYWSLCRTCRGVDSNHIPWWVLWMSTIFNEA